MFPLTISPFYGIIPVEEKAIMETSQITDESDKPKELTNSVKGKKAEKLFQDYLNSLKIPFYRIDQEKESSSEELKGKQIHRPDFIVHTNVGIFYIDVKYRSKMNFGESNEIRFYLKQYELFSLHNFQDEFHLPVWVAFTENLNEPEFYYASISELHKYFETISIEINKICSKEDLKKFEECFIFIPDVLLYDHFSFENGFYKKADLSFYEIEIKHHIEVVKKIRNPEAVKWAGIYKKS
jgi:hypothetical protein